MKKIRYALWALVAVVAIGVGVIALMPRERGFGEVSFSLVDHTGAPITDAAFRGQPSGLFFGFTRCPEVCPTTLSEIAVWLDQLGAAGEEMRFFFITVDPERDDPKTIAGYVDLFSDQITGITGDPAEIEKLADAWGVYSEKVATGDDDYTVNHTASVFLLNDDGGFEGTIAYEEDIATAVGKLRRLLAES